MTGCDDLLNPPSEEDAGGALDYEAELCIVIGMRAYNIYNM